MKLGSNHTVEFLEGEELKRLEENNNPFPDGIVRLTPGGWLYPGALKYMADSLYNFQWRTSDTALIGTAKTGTTWLQEILWTMKNNPDLNHPDADKPILVRVVNLDLDMFFNTNSYKGKQTEPDPLTRQTAKAFKEMFPDKNPDDGISLQTAQAQSDPRVIKAHFPISIHHPKLLDTVKCVYVTRNPRDNVISFYHMMRTFEYFNYTGTIDDFVDSFIKGETIYTRFDIHVKEAWERRSHPNLHMVFYEDLKANTLEELRKLNTFIGTNLTEEQLMNVKHYTSFSEMKKRDNFFFTSKKDAPAIREDLKKKSDGFYRKGIVGDWKTGLSQESLAKIKKWTEEQMNEIPFKYNI